MRTIYFASKWGSVGFLALRMKQAGVPVLLYIHEKSARDILKGLVPKTDSQTPPRDALVIFDDIGFGEWGQHLRAKGHLVIGGNPFDTKLEKDRWSGIQIMQQLGIETPPTKQFTTTTAAQKFLEQQDGNWFVKVSGGADCASTCNGDVATLVRYLDWAGTQSGVKSFILQQRVDGVEVSTNGWFDGARFVAPFDGTFEDKKHLAGDLGPRTGCEANVVWFHDRLSRLPAETVGRAEAVLAQEGYVGPIDLNAIVAKNGTAYGLEWTARLGFDATQAWSSHFEPKALAEQLEAFAAGALLRWEPRSGVGVTLRISIPPYPGNSTSEAQKMAGFPVDKKWVTSESHNPEDVMAGLGGPVIAGASGLVGTVGAFGPKFKPLLHDVLEIANSLKLQNKQYRVDPLERAAGDWDDLVRLKKLSARPA